jgi:glycosyltransferase involved in cell wall biosynthesis
MLTDGVVFGIGPIVIIVYRPSTVRDGNTARQPLPSLSVLRIYQSGVVDAWRARDRALRARGVDLRLVSAAHWNEGGKEIFCEHGDDDFIVVARTVGHQPNLFLYDPIALWKELRKQPIDLIDAHHEPASLATFEILCLRWLARNRAPVVLYSAQNIYKRYPLPFRWMERRALRAAVGIHVCNEAAGEVVRRKGFSGIVEELPLGVDVDRFRPGPAPNTHAGPLSIGYVGRLEDYKGVDVLIDAVAGQDDWKVHIVGDGPSAAKIRERAEPLGAQVTFSGFLTTDELPAVYRSFDVIVVPSLDTPSWTEQFCRVAVEAMASGVPIVASRSGALPEVVGDAGILVPQGDPAALCDALAHLAADPEHRLALGRIARERSRRFAWACIAESQQEFYVTVAA